MQYDDDNKGAIWNAKERASDKHPHFTGRAMVGGTEYYVSAWKRDPDGNPKAPVVKFSFKKVDDVRAQPQQTMQQPQQATGQQYAQATAQQYAQATGKPAQPSSPIDFDDDIPF